MPESEDAKLEKLMDEINKLREQVRSMPQYLTNTNVSIITDHLFSAWQCASRYKGQLQRRCIPS